jgi:hypothetical protein
MDVRITRDGKVELEKTGFLWENADVLWPIEQVGGYETHPTINVAPNAAVYPGFGVDTIIRSAKPTEFAIYTVKLSRDKTSSIDKWITKSFSIKSASDELKLLLDTSWAIPVGPTTLLLIQATRDPNLPSIAFPKTKEDRSTATAAPPPPTRWIPQIPKRYLLGGAGVYYTADIAKYLLLGLSQNKYINGQEYALAPYFILGGIAAAGTLAYRVTRPPPPPRFVNAFQFVVETKHAGQPPVIQKSGIQDEDTPAYNLVYSRKCAHGDTWLQLVSGDTQSFLLVNSKTRPAVRVDFAAPLDHQGIQDILLSIDTKWLFILYEIAGDKKKLRIDVFGQRSKRAWVHWATHERIVRSCFGRPKLYYIEDKDVIATYYLAKTERVFLVKWTANLNKMTERTTTAVLVNDPPALRIVQVVREMIVLSLSNNQTKSLRLL